MQFLPRRAFCVSPPSIESASQFTRLNVEQSGLCPIYSPKYILERSGRIIYSTAGLLDRPGRLANRHDLANPSEYMLFDILPQNVYPAGAVAARREESRGKIILLVGTALTDVFRCISMKRQLVLYGSV